MGAPQVLVPTKIHRFVYQYWFVNSQLVQILDGLVSIWVTLLKNSEFCLLYLKRRELQWGLELINIRT